MKIKFATAAVLMNLAIVSFVPMQAAFAVDSGIICASIAPCDGNGGVQAAYQGGACSATYAAQCATQAINDINDQLVQYDKIVSELQRENSILKKQIAQLKRAHR